jgi:hypothetical protein
MRVLLATIAVLTVLIAPTVVRAENPSEKIGFMTRRLQQVALA